MIESSLVLRVCYARRSATYYYFNRFGLFASLCERAENGEKRSCFWIGAAKDLIVTRHTATR
jgi:hypothetical protein